MHAMESQIADRGYPTARLAASLNSVGFYERLGFRTVTVHEEGTHSMTKDLRTTSSRAQCIVVREGQLLLARHRHDGREWWCLPGGGIESGESPSEAAIRELREECNVDGRVVSQTAVFMHDDEQHHTFHVDIGNQIPSLGNDPDVPSHRQVLVDLDWVGLERLSEKDRVYLWTAGLLAVPGFLTEISGWPDAPSYPRAP